jgi:hypothetical protein
MSIMKILFKSASSQTSKQQRQSTKTNEHADAELCSAANLRDAFSGVGSFIEKDLKHGALD